MRRIIVLGPISRGHTTKIVIQTAIMDEIMMKLPYSFLFGVERILALKTGVKFDRPGDGLDTFKNPHLRTFNMYQRRI